MVFDADRPSDSRHIERVWRCHSVAAGDFLSVASSHWELVVTRLHGRTTVTLRGPETTVRRVHCPAEGEWFAIRFKAGTFMPRLPLAQLLNGQDVRLPQPTKRTFWLAGKACEVPDFEHAETFVAKLAKEDVIAHDRTVAAVLEGSSPSYSLRSAQRHFQLATGMTYGRYRQIERARYAVSLLRDGVSISDSVHDAGFYDQPHLTRSLKALIGVTPAGIVQDAQQLSFLYKTSLSRWT